MVDQNTPGLVNSDFNRGSALLHALGSFWVYYFDQADVLQKHLRHRGWEFGQSYVNFLEMVASISRFDIPVFHKEIFYPLVLKQSEMTYDVIEYGEPNVVYGPQLVDGEYTVTGQTIRYGEPAGRYYKHPLPPGLVKIDGIITDKIIYPSVLMTSGIEFHVIGDYIYFAENPFNNEAFKQRDVVDQSGDEVDAETVLWVYNGEWDLDYVYTQFAYVLNLKMDSTEFYKDFVNAYWNMFVDGPSILNVKLLIAALMGVPLALGGETVETIYEQPTHTSVITDQNVYRISPLATVSVAEGDSLSLGDSLVEGFKIIELRQGDTISVEDLPQITLDSSTISGDYHANLIFENAETPLEYSTDSEGNAVVTFEVSGFDEDIATFWESVHAMGLASGNTFARLLDTREDPETEPGPSDLPSTINPAQFIIDNFFMNNFFVIKINTAIIDDTAPGIRYLSHLRRNLPPHITYRVFIQLYAGEENYDTILNIDEAMSVLDVFVTSSDFDDELSLEGDPYAQEISVRVFNVTGDYYENH